MVIICQSNIIKALLFRNVYPTYYTNRGEAVYKFCPKVLNEVARFLRRNS